MIASRTLPPITIALDDYGRLARLARALASQSHPLASPLFQELLRADLCEPDALPRDVVAMDRFVAFRLDGDDKPEYRALIHPDDRMWPPAEISILSPVGISLIGLRPGDRISLLGADKGPDRWLEVVAVGPGMTGGLQTRPMADEGASGPVPN